jgi:hypothetical protein
MGQRTEELSQDIERTRHRLRDDLEALDEKVRPSRVVARRTSKMKAGVSRAKERVMGTAGDAAGAAGNVPETAIRRTEGNPLAAGAIAFAAGWLVSSLVPASDTEERVAREVGDRAMAGAEPVKEEVARAASELKDDLEQPARDAAQHLRESTGEAAATVADSGKAAVQEGDTAR